MCSGLLDRQQGGGDRGADQQYVGGQRPVGPCRSACAPGGDGEWAEGGCGQEQGALAQKIARHPGASASQSPSGATVMLPTTMMVAW